MEFYDVARTTFAAREFVDEPVTDEVLRKILENARFAPSGGNRQGWKVLVIREQETRDALVPMIMPTFQRYIAQVQAGESPWNTIDETNLREAEIAATEVPEGFVRALVSAPVVLLVLVDLSVVASFDVDLERVGLISGASVYPFVWNILLSARNEGYGGTLTTFLCAREPAVQKLLGIPAHMAVAAMVPLGKPVKQLTRLKRKPVDEFAMLERWGGALLG
ncbi:MAG: nitroreductase family protein [Gammaproteobacteria bacterium]|nr:nitroreductase family protein [Gammaproteobacteria bacterium]